MANSKGVQVPFTRREWDIVTDVYRSDKVSELKHAVALIVSWKARSGDSVHVAADMTEMLLRAVIMDKETKNDDWFNIGNVKLAYCTAIIRFVNYVNEICQSNYKFKSIASAVGGVGIPQWVVDIRHGATHSHLPPLESLRQAATYCRNWLWEHHWSRPVAEAIGLNLNIQNANDENELQKEAAYLIDRFMLHSLQQMKQSTRQKKNKPDKKIKLQKILTKMETFIMLHPWEFLGAFLQEGYLILNAKQIKSIDCNLFSENEDIWIIPEDLQLFWKPIFHYLNEAKMLPELLFQLLETTSDGEIQPIRKRQLVGWSDRMLIAYVESNVLTQSEWERILKAMMLAPKELREVYFDKVLVKIEKMTKKEQDALRQLVVLSSTKTIASEKSVSQDPSNIAASSFKTVEDLRKLMMQKENEKQPETRDSSNTHRWSTCNPLEWKGIPLGLTPEQSTESLYLVVEPEVTRVWKRQCVA
uniref:Ribosomal biogenesis protein LAS1L n=1 Tax=Loa loa TaxID=7209 RepID=A0A1I7VH40_LOALO